MFILGTGISDTCVHTLLQISDVFKKFNVETYTETQHKYVRRRYKNTLVVHILYFLLFD